MLDLCCRTGSSLAAAIGDSSLVAVCRPLIVVASLDWEHRLWGTRASEAVVPRLQSTVSTAVVHRPSCSRACGVFQDQRSNPCLLRWQADSLPLSPGEAPTWAFSVSEQGAQGWAICRFKSQLYNLPFMWLPHLYDDKMIEGDPENSHV